MGKSYFDDILTARGLKGSIYGEDMEDVVPQEGGILGGFDYRKPENQFGAIAPQPPLNLPSVNDALKKAEAIRGLPDESAAQLIQASNQLYNRANRMADLTRPEVAAFLEDVVPTAEGGAVNRRIGGATFTGNAHPGPNNDGNSAAGLLQMTEGTWKDMAGPMGLTNDFNNRTNQLLAGVGLLDRNQALAPLRRGDFENSLNTMGSKHQWDALPGGDYPNLTLEQARKIYEEGLRRRMGL